MNKLKETSSVRRRRRKKQSKVVSTDEDSGIATATYDNKSGSSDSDDEDFRPYLGGLLDPSSQSEYLKQTFDDFTYNSENEGFFNPSTEGFKKTSNGFTIYPFYYDPENEVTPHSSSNGEPHKGDEDHQNCSPRDLWTKIIPYKISDDVDEKTKLMIADVQEELERRSCLRFIERDVEDDYLQFVEEKRSWSFIGRMGGKQAISIEAGCEETGTILHEIMHAIGFHHEHSRPDRDDYVEIRWSGIPEDEKKNFVKQPDVPDEILKSPYDYESVMHYSGDPFVNGGKSTIRSLDPRYQNVIGQRVGLSEGDVKKINSLYKCAETTRKSFYENFESGNMGGYSQSNHSKQPIWRLQKNWDKARKPSSLLPDIDSTYGKEGQGSYAYLMNEGKPGRVGKLESIRYVSKVKKQCLMFSFRMDDTKNNSLYVHYADVDPKTGDTTSLGSPVRKFRMGCGDKWCVHQETIEAPSNYRLVFRGRFGDTSAGVIAVDDIRVTDRKCEDSYFTVENYVEKTKSYSIDEYVESETMYTNERGYAYKLRAFPNGTRDDIAEGYPSHTGVHIVIVGGKYDDELQWPFPRHIVKLCANIQAADPAARSDHCEYFDVGGDTYNAKSAYQKPKAIGVANKPIKCLGFMENSEYKTMGFLKQGSASFSTTLTNISQKRKSSSFEVTRGENKSTTAKEHSESSSNKKNDAHGGLKKRHAFNASVDNEFEYGFKTEEKWGWASAANNTAFYVKHPFRPKNTTSKKDNYSGSSTEFARKPFSAKGNYCAPNSENTNSTSVEELSTGSVVVPDTGEPGGGFFAAILEGFINVLRTIGSYLFKALESAPAVSSSSQSIRWIPQNSTTVNSICSSVPAYGNSTSFSGVCLPQSR